MSITLSSNTDLTVNLDDTHDFKIVADAQGFVTLELLVGGVVALQKAFTVDEALDFQRKLGIMNNLRRMELNL